MGLKQAFSQLDAVRYGDSDRIAAGEEGFRDFYVSRLEDVRVHGKRPDLLLVPKSLRLAPDLSGQRTVDVAAIVRKAHLSIEVRSSKFEALQYMRVRAERKAEGQKSGRETPNFTVKVEGLKTVYRWIEFYDIEQLYCQVFFDSVFAINILKIFEVIGSGKGFTIESPTKIQQKATIFISITTGTQLGSFKKHSKFEVEHQTTSLGRHDVYVRPVGGRIELDIEEFRKACVASETLR